MTVALEQWYAGSEDRAGRGEDVGIYSPRAINMVLTISLNYDGK